MFFHILILVFALCLDTFVASTAYGTNQIRLSHKQIAVFNIICCFCLGISLMFGTFLDSQIPETFTKEICFLSFLFLGFVRLFDSAICHYLQQHKFIHKNTSFTLSHLNLMIDIYIDPVKADIDQNQCLSWKEVIFFSLAMSIDSLFTGIMAAFLKVSILITLITTFIVGELFTYLGLFIGHKISSHCPKDLTWIGGILFILLAFLKVN